MQPPARFPIPDLDTLPTDIREQILAIQEKLGFVPNIFLTLSPRPAEFRAFFAYHEALMEKESGLSKAEREMIVVTTSALNRCQYCVVAHGAVLRIRSGNPRLADQLAIDYRNAEINARQKAMLEVALKVAGPDSAGIEDTDLDQLRAVGFGEEDIWDIGAIAAFFAMSNRLVGFTGMQANPEFYNMGRTPRSS